VIGDKAHRQRAILELVKSRPIQTQEQLVEELRRLDHQVTQATVSRDIRELGLLRAPSADGSRYAPRTGLGARGGSVLRDFVLSIDGVEFLTIVHTPPGTANLVALAIDEAAWPEVAGTLAGDDTVLVILRSQKMRGAFEAHLDHAGAAGE
jgi:transcriptional regulator of arginine metabolism